jgi:hypothetical protein
VLGLLVLLLVSAAAARRDFIGDGVRHIPAALAGEAPLGEARWLLFPALVFVVLRPLSALGTMPDVERAIQALLWLSVACGVVFLVSLNRWLRAESGDGARRAGALMLAGSCAPFLLLFSDVAEVQIAAAIAAAGLAYARVEPDNQRRAIVAIAAIGCATLLYQGTVLALGMLPLVTSGETLRRGRVTIVLCGTVALVLIVMVVAQFIAGTPLSAAVTTTLGGERNALTRSFMSQQTIDKYVIALVAGPPQGLVGLIRFDGVAALMGALRTPDAESFPVAVTNTLRLLLGAACLGVLAIAGIRHKDWRLLLAALVVLAIPVVRNQQYGYVKFYALWPIPVALAALRCRVRVIAAIAGAVFTANALLLAQNIQQGRRIHRILQSAYQKASPSTCWMTAGWAPPMWYLWPGTTAPILGTLGTGRDARVQADALTASLRHCFCQSSAVWTDATVRDAALVSTLAEHFDYRDRDLRPILLDDSPSMPAPAIRVYPETRRQDVCKALTSD